MTLIPVKRKRNMPIISSRCLHIYICYIYIICIYNKYIYIYIYMYISAYIHIQRILPHWVSKPTRYVYVSICMFMYVYVCLCMFMYVYVCMYTNETKQKWWTLYRDIWWTFAYVSVHAMFYDAVYSRCYWFQCRIVVCVFLYV